MCEVDKVKRYKIINKKRFYSFVIFTVYISFIAFSFFRSFGNAENISEDIKYKEVYVMQGDTVWDIALEYKPKKLDVRDMVSQIRDFNDLKDLDIIPGDVIKVPLRKR